MIGEYLDWVLILPVSRAVADATGEEVESWPTPDPAVPHAAKIEGPGGDEATSNLRGSGQGFNLRFRHEVDLYAVDRVQLSETDEVFEVTGVWRERLRGGGWQTVCTVSGPV